jgi:hypothetical protein
MKIDGLRTALAFSCAALVATLGLSSARAADKMPQKLFAYEFLLPSTKLAGGPNPSYGDNGQLLPPSETTVRFKNESPPSVGASNFASITFALSSLVATGVSCGSRATCSIDFANNAILVTNISPPIQAQEIFDVTVQVSSCVVSGDASVPQDSVRVSTGSQINNGDMFVLYTGDNSFPVLSTLSDPATKKPSGIRCGDIDCGETFAVANNLCQTTTSDPECVTTVRGNNTNGGCGATVDYFVTNDIATAKKKLHFVWQTDSFAAFAYRVNIPSVAEPYLQMSWLPQTGSPVFIPAPACTIQVAADASYDQVPLPYPYGTLGQDVKLNSSKIQVDVASGVTVPATPFAIVIGTERMLVTAVGNNQWNVTRGDGFTTVATHAKGAPVMFTALPTLVQDYKGVPYTLDAQQTAAGYKLGLKARMCLASPLVPHVDPDGIVIWSGWAIDAGDGWMSW